MLRITRLPNPLSRWASTMVAAVIGIALVNAPCLAQDSPVPFAGATRPSRAAGGQQARHHGPMVFLTGMPVSTTAESSHVRKAEP
jgi:hypothetical protein